MSTWKIRILAIVGAFILMSATLIIWGSFGGLVMKAMNTVSADPKPKPKTEDSGVFTVNVLPAPATPDCSKDRDKSCPK
ncbi:MAG TPA: hypothetical protein VGG48_16565 [Rhizomicrobium sp.]|jgi:hypothetical protein